MYDEVITMLGLTDSEVDERTQSKIEKIIKLTEKRLFVLLGNKTEEIPADLEYIVVEVAIRRFNRIGSEGLASHTVEGETMTWPDDDFAPFNDDIQAWLDAQDDPESNRGRVKFI